MARIAGRASISKPTHAAAGFPESPRKGVPPMSPNVMALPGLSEMRSKSTVPSRRAMAST